MSLDLTLFPIDEHYSGRNKIIFRACCALRCDGSARSQKRAWSKTKAQRTQTERAQAHQEVRKEAKEE